MTASQKAKAAGLKNLAEMCEITGQSPQTLNNWFNDKPQLFTILLRGCAVTKHKNTIFNLLNT
jgi:hypothetical protein